MAERQWEVIQLWSGGVSWRGASDEAREKARQQWQAMQAKWGAAGIERAAEYHGSGIPDFGNCIIWKLQSIEQYGEMLEDLDKAKDLTKILKTYRFTLGRGG